MLRRINAIDESESENVGDDFSNGRSDNSSDSETADKPPFFIGRSGIIIAGCNCTIVDQCNLITLKMSYSDKY